MPIPSAHLVQFPCHDGLDLDGCYFMARWPARHRAQCRATRRDMEYHTERQSNTPSGAQLITFYKPPPPPPHPPLPPSLWCDQRLTHADTGAASGMLVSHRLTHAGTSAVSNMLRSHRLTHADTGAVSNKLESHRPTHADTGQRSKVSSDPIPPPPSTVTVL